MSYNPGSGKKKKRTFQIHQNKTQAWKHWKRLPCSVLSLHVEWVNKSVRHPLSHLIHVSLLPDPFSYAFSISRGSSHGGYDHGFPCTIVLDHPVSFSFWGSHHTTQQAKADCCAWSQDPPPQQAAEAATPCRRPEGLTRLFTTQGPWIRAGSTTVYKLSSLLRRTVSSL